MAMKKRGYTCLCGRAWRDSDVAVPLDDVSVLCNHCGGAVNIPKEH